MATTRIMTVHPKKACGPAQTIKDLADYINDHAKTKGGLYITGFGCVPENITEEFMFSRDEYKSKTGRDQGEKEILAYHVRQSFLPGEIDAGMSNKLGYELTGGEFSFIVCTHTDTPHIHNHILVNAVNMDCDKKFRNEIGSFKRVRQIADRISAANNLSVVEKPDLSKGTKNRYEKQTKREGLVRLIDEILEKQQPKNFDEFLKLLEKKGCKVRRRGKTISVRPPGAERFFRFKSGEKGMAEGYDEASLRKKIAEMQRAAQADSRDGFDSKAEKNTTDTPDTEDISSAANKQSTLEADASATETPAEPSIKISHDKKINLLIDIENSIKAQTSPGYERWAKGFNLQQAAETLLFLQTNNLTDLGALTQAASQAKTYYDALQNRIDSADARIKEVNTLQRHIGAYNKNRDVYSQYLLTKRSPAFRQENEKAIASVEEAKAYFDSSGLEKLPTINELREEYSRLSQEKHDCYQARNEMRRHISDLQSAKKNAEILNVVH